MPRYHIELRSQERVWETFDVDAGDHGEARLEVAKFVGELLREHAGKIWVDQDWRVDVTDADGLILFVMQLLVTDSPAARAPRR